MNEIHELNTDWIDNFEDLDNSYKLFYCEDLKTIKIHYIYLNKQNEIEKVKKEKILLKTSNNISRDELIKILKDNKTVDNKLYSILSILKYNIDIEPGDINYYLKTQQSDDTFIKLVSNIDSIPFKKSITMFHSLNNIFIIFCEKNIHIDTKNNTKRIYFRHIHGNRNKTRHNIH